jgi:hypothetical protein
MTHVRGEDEGVYICRASNALGEAVTTASMKIRSKPVNCIHNVTTITTHYCTLQAKKLFGEKMFVAGFIRCSNVKAESVQEEGTENDILSKRGEVMGDWRKFHNEELHDVYF